MKYKMVILLLLVASIGSLGMSTIKLQDGGSIKADIISKKPDRVFVDLGFTVIAIPKDSIVSIESQSHRHTSGGFTDNLYRVLKHPEARPVKDLAAELGNAVVTVRTAIGLGSGFIIHPDGYLITNDHVIAGENRISVTVFQTGGSDRHILRKDQFDNVRIIAASAEWDLALLKIEGAKKIRFKTVPIGDANELRQGQPVFAIGNPLGLERSVSQGIVSIRNRLINGRLYIQTTAQINPGNSGGPLFDLAGEVVGVNNMKVVSQGAEGLGFAIPANVVKSFLENRDAFAFDPRNPNNGYRYNTPPSPDETKEEGK